MDGRPAGSRSHCDCCWWRRSARVGCVAARTPAPRLTFTGLPAVGLLDSSIPPLTAAQDLPTGLWLLALHAVVAAALIPAVVPVLPQRRTRATAGRPRAARRGLGKQRRHGRPRAARETVVRADRLRQSVVAASTVAGLAIAATGDYGTTEGPNLLLRRCTPSPSGRRSTQDPSPTPLTSPHHPSREPVTTPYGLAQCRGLPACRHLRARRQPTSPGNPPRGGHHGRRGPGLPPGYALASIHRRSCG